MRRSDQLTPLSHDHHIALHEAMRLRRATVQSAAEAVTRFFSTWDVHGRPHFDAEEQLLTPALLPGDEEWAAGVARMIGEHRDLRARAAALPQAVADGDVDAIHVVGDRWQAHVRFEERELFPFLEERLAPDALDALGAALLEIHARGSDPLSASDSRGLTP